VTLAADAGALFDCSWNDTFASPARVRDAALGGKDNYAIDRTVLAELDYAAPGFTYLLRAVRSWHVRVVRILAARGFDQFVDCSAGLPTMRENTHQTAQRQNREAKVVYVDSDRLVVAYGRALLDDNDNTEVVLADYLDPVQLLNHEQVQEGLDLTRPVVLLLTSGVQHEPLDVRLAQALAGYRELLPPGSAIALSNWSPPDDLDGHDSLARAIEDVWNSRCHGEVRCRDDTEIRPLFDGFDLLEPGLTRLDSWWPTGPVLHAPPPAQRFALGGVGIKH